MYKLPPVNSKVTAPSKEIEGLLVSTLSALMKTIKSRNPKSIGFMLRERLANPQDRRNLNILLNDIRAAVITRSKDLSTPKGPVKAPLATAVDKLVGVETPVVSAKLGESEHKSVAARLIERCRSLGI